MPVHSSEGTKEGTEKKQNFISLQLQKETEGMYFSNKRVSFNADGSWAFTVIP